MVCAKRSRQKPIEDSFDGLMNKVYDNFLCEFKDKVEFKRYIEIYHHLRVKE